MDKQNMNCIQIVNLTFNLYPKTGKYKNGLFPSEPDKGSVWEDILGLKDCLSARLEKMAEMLELLLNLNRDWKIVRHRDKIILQTTSIDFTDMQNLLAAKGLSHEDCSLSVDYARKWGVL